MVDDDTTEKDENNDDENRQSAEFSKRLFGLGGIVAISSVLISYLIARDPLWTDLELDERAFFGLGFAGPAVLLASSIPLTRRSLAIIAACLVVAMIPVWLMLDRWETTDAITVIVIVWVIATPLIGVGMYLTREKR